MDHGGDRWRDKDGRGGIKRGWVSRVVREEGDASKVKESTREPVDLGGLSKRVSRFVVCTSSTKNPFPSYVHERPREDPSSPSLLRTASDIYAMAQIKYFNRGGTGEGEEAGGVGDDGDIGADSGVDSGGNRSGGEARGTKRAASKNRQTALIAVPRLLT